MNDQIKKIRQYFLISGLIKFTDDVNNSNGYKNKLMKVIALRGPENSGKSHTLNVVYQFLLRDGYIQVPGHFIGLGNPKFEDILDILEKGSKKVGVCGMGDYQKGGGSLMILLDDLEKRGCDVVVCCCRNITAIEKAVSAYSNHVFINKTISSGPENHRVVNGFDAEQMFGLV